MSVRRLHECCCAKCQQAEPNHTKELHAQLNMFLGSLTEDQRTWFLGMESMKPNYGGDQELEAITGVSATVIAKTRWAIQMAQRNRWAFATDHRGAKHGNAPFKKYS